MAAIYKISEKGYLLHADRKAVSGFRLAWKPFIRISENDFTADVMANAIKEVIKESGIEERAPDPKNWSENSKQFLKDTGLKSLKELNAFTTKHCGIDKDNGNIVFTPTKHAEPPDQGFVNKSKDEPNIIIPITASNEEITQAFELALSKCK
jgi:hypothetical protein